MRNPSDNGDAVSDNGVNLYPQMCVRRDIHSRAERQDSEEKMTSNQMDLLALWITMETAKGGDLEPWIYNADIETCIQIYENIRNNVAKTVERRSNED